MDPAVDQEPGGRGAVLARVVVGDLGEGGGGGLDVHVLVDDDGGVAAEFQVDPFEAGRGGRRDLPAGADAAGDGDQGDRRVGGEGPAGVAVAADDVEHPRRQVSGRDPGQQAGSDPQSLRTTATPTGNGWVLNGEKWFVTVGDHADFMIVLAAAGDEGAPTLFLVDKDTPGIEMTRVPRWMHTRPVRTPAARTIRSPPPSSWPGSCGACCPRTRSCARTGSSGRSCGYAPCATARPGTSPSTCTTNCTRGSAQSWNGASLPASSPTATSAGSAPWYWPCATASASA